MRSVFKACAASVLVMILAAGEASGQATHPATQMTDRLSETIDAINPDTTAEPKGNTTDNPAVANRTISDAQVEALRELVETLESQSGRENLIAELKAVIESAEAVDTVNNDGEGEQRDAGTASTGSPSGTDARADAERSGSAEDAQRSNTSRQNDGSSGDVSSGRDADAAGGDSSKGGSVTQSVNEALEIDKTADKVIDTYEGWLWDFGIRYDAGKKAAMVGAVLVAWALSAYLIVLLSRHLRMRVSNARRIGNHRRKRFEFYIWAMKAQLLFGVFFGFFYLVMLTLNLDSYNTPYIPSPPYIFGAGGAIFVLFIVSSLITELIYTGLDRMSETDNRRIRTVAPLIRNMVLLAMILIGGITFLSELGIDIMPLLAGAGVIGIAIGFGAQTLFKDLITGLIVIVEDLFQIGDWISVAGSEGTVENITLRKVDLRDLSGTIHTVPFGSFDTVRNHMKGVNYAVLDIEVGYRENLDSVFDEIADVDKDLREKSPFMNVITGELETLGVEYLGDSAIGIRVRVRTLPGEHWDVAREYRRRIKERFDVVGIEIPFPHQTIYFGSEKDDRNRYSDSKENRNRDESDAA